MTNPGDYLTVYITTITYKNEKRGRDTHNL